jgi:NAD(P)H-hydrate repair Nnr-like enzyme with NAD(P)H-hydrate epimerase domain
MRGFTSRECHAAIRHTISIALQFCDNANILFASAKIQYTRAMSVPVINTAQMREWERATWASGQTEIEVIRRVGKRVARRARRLTRADDLILILAGKGKNGSDARATREFLDGRKNELLDIAAPENFLPALETALAQKPALIIDGLFGIGLNRPLDNGWIKLIRTRQRIENPRPVH